MSLQASHPAVSVILPTRNRSQLLSKAIRSVLAQTFSDIELIVVDDGSSDGTPKVVESLFDERIRFLRHEVHRGAGAARNVGLKEARGDFVAFLDDDDEFLPQKLADQTKAFRGAVTGVNVVVSDVQDLQEGTPVEFFPYDGESGNIFLHFLAGNFFPLGTALIRRQDLPEFDERLVCLEDIDFLLKVLHKGKVLYQESPCAVCNLDQNRPRLSHDKIAMHRSFRALQTRWFNDPDDVLLKTAFADLLINFSLRLIALGYTDDLTREYVNKAFSLKKDARRLWYRILNLAGPAVIKKLL